MQRNWCDGAGSAHHPKMLTAAQWRLLTVMINKGNKAVVLVMTIGKVRSPSAATSPALIAATVMVMGGLKMKISMKGSCLGGWISQRWLAGTEKWFKRWQRRLWNTDDKDVITDG